MVKDTGANVIAESMQLIAGRIAQEYNQRQGRQGAFWEDRYHAAPIEADEHVHRCLIYIDLNIVRPGVRSHPVEWAANTSIAGLSNTNAVRLDKGGTQLTVRETRGISV